MGGRKLGLWAVVGGWAVGAGDEGMEHRVPDFCSPRPFEWSQGLEGLSGTACCRSAFEVAMA